MSGSVSVTEYTQSDAEAKASVMRARGFYDRVVVEARDVTYGPARIIDQG